MAIQPSEPEKTVSAVDAQPEDPKPKGKKAKTDGRYYYCLEENHPGSPNFQSQPLSVNRIFQSTEDIPVCPACGRQVSALPCDGPDIPPEYIQSLQERFGR